MFEYTRCDGIMIGRGCLGNPWIFDRIKYYLKKKKKLDPISDEEKIKVLKEHFKLLLILIYLKLVLS